MSATAQIGVGKPILRIRGALYPVLLPTIRDPRLHLAAVIVSLQVLGQTAFDFRLSIAQILVSVGTCGLLEVAIAFRRQRVIMWPASALLTGNGVAFILRVPGTHHGDWWSVRGIWIFAGTAAISLLSKYLIRWRGRHVFNPSNIGLVVCFLALGKDRADPLDFWWAPMSTWLAVALVLIVVGGLLILSRLDLLGVALGFWVAFAAGIGVVALSGHAMTARWHLGSITGGYFWWLLVSSPEILVFLFFMLTDPKTVPAGRLSRLVFAVSVGLLASLLIAPMRTEFASKVAVLGALAIVCGSRPILERFPSAAASLRARVGSLPRIRIGALALSGAASFAGLLVVAGIPARSGATALVPIDDANLPQVTVVPAKGVDSQIGGRMAQRMAHDLVADLRLEADALGRRDPNALFDADRGARLVQLQDAIRETAGREIVVPRYSVERMSVALEPREGQADPAVVATVAGKLQTGTFAGTPPMETARSEPIAFRRTFEIVLARGRYRIVVDRGPGTRAAPVRVR